LELSPPPRSRNGLLADSALPRHAVCAVAASTPKDEASVRAEVLTNGGRYGMHELAWEKRLSAAMRTSDFMMSSRS